MARFIERLGRVYIETDKGTTLAYFDTDGTFVCLDGIAAATATGAPASGTKAVTTAFPADPKRGAH